MKTVIVITCLVAVVFTSPIRKVRNLGSDSYENHYRYYQQFYPPVYNRYSPYQPGFPMQPYSPHYPYIPMTPRFSGYFPTYNYPNFRQFPVFNGFARNSNSQLPKVKKDNNVIEESPQEYSVIRNTRPLSMSSEASYEDSGSMENTNFRIPFLDVPYDVPDYGVPGDTDYGVPGDRDYGVPRNPDYGVPRNPDYGVPRNPDYGVSGNPDYGVSGNPDYGVPRNPDYGVPRNPDYGVPRNPDYGVPRNPDYGVPGNSDYGVAAVPDNKRPFTPEIDANAVDAGFNQQNTKEVATEVLDPEEPASVLPYTDSVQGMDSLGLNGEDYSMIRDVDEGLSQQDTIYEPVGLDEKYDQTLNNEEFSNQQMPTENLDEDDLTLEVEDISKNSVDEHSIVLSNDEDTGEIESNLSEEDNDKESNEDENDEMDSEADNVQIELEDNHPYFVF
ncbi:uncharacterized protein LOC144494256 [Mustelus asterias]